MRFPVFLSGVIIMALELVVGRLLTPYYGDGVTVWGAAIGVLLCALALGYYVGGYLADKKEIKKNIHTVFVGCFCIAGFFTLLVPSLIKALASQHILITAFCTLTLPVCVLGMVSPLVLTQSTSTLKKLGMNAGTVYALGTVGSIVGTFGTVFVLFQYFRVSEVVVFLAGLCAVSALLLSTTWRYIGILLLFVCILAYPTPVVATQGVDETFPSAYGEIRVKDLAGTRHVSLNLGHMSEINLSNRIQKLPYWDYLYCMEAPFLVQEFSTAPRLLNIGLAAGYYPNRIHEVYDARVESAEINPVMVEVARNYFAYDLPVHIGDGRQYLEASSNVYDVIALDVMHYTNYSYHIPKQFVTKEFFAMATNKLDEDGYFVLHLVGGPKDEFFVNVLTTLEEEFSFVATYDCDSSVVMVAHQDAFVVPELEQYVFTTTERGRVYYDDFFPTI